MADLNYDIVADEPREDLQQDGRWAKVRDITFVLRASGRRGHITVQLRNYSPEFVHAEIMAQAQLIDAVSKLGG